MLKVRVREGVQPTVQGSGAPTVIDLSSLPSGSRAGDAASAIGSSASGTSSSWAKWANEAIEAQRQLQVLGANPAPLPGIQVGPTGKCYFCGRPGGLNAGPQCPFVVDVTKPCREARQAGELQKEKVAAIRKAKAAAEAKGAGAVEE